MDHRREDEAELFDLVTAAGALEVKSGDAVGEGADRELARLLSDFTGEMRAQFDLFRRLRAGAEALLDGADEAAAKLARADIKAATDAIALIIRTLEKIDSLQRQLARDRAEADDRRLEQAAPERLRARLAALIEARVREGVDARLQQHGRPP
jgi:hypothetical protein